MVLIPRIDKRSPNTTPHNSLAPRIEVKPTSASEGGFCSVINHLQKQDHVRVTSTHAKLPVLDSQPEHRVCLGFITWANPVTVDRCSYMPKDVGRFVMINLSVDQGWSSSIRYIYVYVIMNILLRSQHHRLTESRKAIDSKSNVARDLCLAHSQNTASGLCVCHGKTKRRTISPPDRSDHGNSKSGS